MSAPLIPNETIHELVAQINSPEMLGLLQRLQKAGFIRYDHQVDTGAAMLLERLADLGLVDSGYKQPDENKPYMWVINHNGTRVLRHFEMGELARQHHEVEAGITLMEGVRNGNGNNGECRTRSIKLESGVHDRDGEPMNAVVIDIEPIKLLEVNENTVPAGVMPLHFGPAPAIGITFPSVIVEVTPDEYKKIQSQELKLPKGWDEREALAMPPGTVGGA